MVEEQDVQLGWRVRLVAGLSTLGSRRAGFCPPMDGDGQVLRGTGDLESGPSLHPSFAYDGYGCQIDQVNASDCSELSRS
jgi:hypothetical protein